MPAARTRPSLPLERQSNDVYVGTSTGAVPTSPAVNAAVRGLVAAVLPGAISATSTCQANFINPHTATKYAVSTSCGGTSGYINRFVAHCGATKFGV